MQYSDEKCFKVLDRSKLFTFEEARQFCANQSATLAVIHSKAEQEFLSEYLFKFGDVVNEIWIGLRKINGLYKWIDDSELDFSEWAIGSPSNRIDFDCVQISSEVYQIGEWVDKPCSRKNIAICQKLPSTSLASLQNALLEAKRHLIDAKDTMADQQKQLFDMKKILNDTRIRLNETASRFNGYFNNLLSNKWIGYKLFTDTDEKPKALIIPLNENKETKSLEEAIKICANYNSTLVEINSWQKHFIFRSFLGQLGSSGLNSWNFWIDGQRDSFGKWKAISSDKELTYLDWYPSFPKDDHDHDALVLQLDPDEQFGKFFNRPRSSKFRVACENVIDF
jgi:hypothetical protein